MPAKRFLLSLDGVRYALAARAHVTRADDPVLPWVSRVAQTVFEVMKANLERDPALGEKARARYDVLLEEASEQARIWREEGHPDYARRLSMALKVEL